MTANATLIENLEQAIQDTESQIQVYASEIERFTKLYKQSQQELEFLRKTLEVYNSLHQNEPKRHTINISQYALEYARTHNNIIDLEVVARELRDLGLVDMNKSKNAIRLMMQKHHFSREGVGIYRQTDN